MRIAAYRSSVLLLLAFSLACQDQTNPPPEVMSIEPATVSSLVRTPAVIEGRHFYGLVRERIDSEDPPSVDLQFGVRIGDEALADEDVVFVDTQTLHVTVPAGLELGVHDLTVITPAGLSGALPGALTVVEGAVGLDVSIEDAPGGQGEPIGPVDLVAGDSLVLYAVLRDSAGEYVMDAEVAWSVRGGIGTIEPGPASMTALQARQAGIGWVVAEHAEAEGAEAGPVVVSAAELARLTIEDAPAGAGVEVGELLQLDTDDVLVFFSVGRDAYGNFVADESATWSLTADLGEIQPGPAASSMLDLKNPGAGRVRISHPSLPGDETGNLVVGPGAVVRVRIESSPGGLRHEIGEMTMDAGSMLPVYAVGYDADGNHAGETEVSWSVTGGIGFMDPEGPASQSVFHPTTPGVGQVIAAPQDAVGDTTGDITVLAGQLARVFIEDAPGGAGQELAAQVLNVEDRLELFAVGRDGAGNFISDVQVTWSASGGIGVIPVGPSSFATFRATEIGSGTVSAFHASVPGDDLDIQVSAGGLVQVQIEDAPGGAGVAVEDLVTSPDDPAFTVWAVGRDASGHYLGEEAVAWSLTSNIGTLTPSADAHSATFQPGRAGSGRIRADHPDPVVRDDQTGTITVAAGEIFQIRIETAPAGAGSEVASRVLVTGDSMNLYAVGRDRAGNFVSDEVVDWAVTGGIGSLTFASGSTTALIAGSAGTGTVEADKPGFGSAPDDVTGTITVTASNIVEYVRIVEAADCGASEVADATVGTDLDIVLYAIGFDVGDNCIGPVDVTWSVAGGIGTVIPGPDTQTLFDPRRVGAGSISASRALATGDSVLYTVNAGALDHVVVEDQPGGIGGEVGAVPMTADETLALHAVGYDADANFVSDETVSWSVTGGIGAVSPGSGESTSFDARTAGSGTVVATHGSVPGDATGLISVSAGEAFAVHIESAPGGQGSEIGALSMTADDSLPVYAVSRDADGNFTSDESATWSVSGGIGSLDPGPAASAVFEAVSVGQGSVTVHHPSLQDDSTGTITVSAGDLAAVRIEDAAGGAGAEIAAVDLSCDDLLPVFAVGRDADGNFTSDERVTWSASGGIGTINAGPSSSAVFDPTRQGTGAVRADHAVVGFDLTGEIRVSIGALYRVRIETQSGGAGSEIGSLALSVGQDLGMYAVGRDRDGNFVSDESVAWSVSGGIGSVSPASGSVTTFSAELTGSGQVLADHAAVLDDSTGTITVSGQNPVDYVMVVDAEGCAGSEIAQLELDADQQVTLHAAGYDLNDACLGPAEVSWQIEGDPIGTLDPAGPSTSTRFDATFVGSGRVVARPVLGTQGEVDIDVTPGALAQVRIDDAPDGIGSPAGTRSMSADQSWDLFAVGYDADGNFTDMQTVGWAVTGGIGAVSPPSGEQTTFSAGKVGSGTVTADLDGFGSAPDDATGTITVSVGALYRVRIEDAAGGTGSEIGSLAMSTDGDLDVFAAGRDADGNFVSDQSVTWSLTAAIGEMSPASGAASVFDPTSPGTGRIRAEHATALADESGDISVSVGALAEIRIVSQAGGAGAEIGAVSRTADQSLDVFAAGFDADGNYRSDESVTWSVSGGIGSIDPGPAASSVFYADTVGTGYVRADKAGFGTSPDDSTGLITVTHGALDDFGIDTIASPKVAGVAFAIFIRARDADGNPVLSYAGSVDISDLSGSISPATSGAFSSGVRQETVVISALHTGDVISVSDGAASGQSNAFDVEGSGQAELWASIAGEPCCLFEGQAITVTLRVDNTGSVGETNVIPLSACSPADWPCLSGSGSASQASGPTPASADIPPGGYQDFVWTYTTAPGDGGIVQYTAYAQGDTAISNEPTSDDVNIFPADCSLYPPQADAGSLGPLTCAEAQAGVQIGGSPTAWEGTAPYAYAWTPGSGLDDASIANPTATLVTSTSFGVLVTDENACTASSSIDIEVLTPTAVFAVNPGSGCTNPSPPPNSTSFNFSGGGSTGENSLCYTFDFGDGDGDGPRISPNSSHAYSDEGVFLARLTVQEGCSGACSVCTGCVDTAFHKVYVALPGDPAGALTFNTTDTPPDAGTPCSADYWQTFTSMALSACGGGAMGAGEVITVEAVRGKIPAGEDTDPGTGGIQLLTDTTSRVSFHLCADKVGGAALVMARAALGAAEGTASTSFEGSASLPVVKDFGPSGYLEIPPPHVIVRFDKDMDPSTIDDSTFQVHDEAMLDLDGTISYDPETRTARFVPDAPLDPAAEVHTVHLKKTIEDIFGMQLDGDFDGVAEGSTEDRFIFVFGATADQSPPSCTCNAISPGTFSPDGDGVQDTATIPVSVSDETGMWLVRVVIRGPGSSAYVRTLTLPFGTGGTANLVWNGRDESGLVVPNGVYECTAVALDAAGNKSASCARQVTVSGALDPADFE
ncbi:MAG: PKD domain-containing protein [Deltaproteobacteria bacterium]|nr:PKD domain-containing protein [Deltaproteobacteria bacterium]